jgi:transcriptional regulator with XRE-family HTH domain
MDIRLQFGKRVRKVRVERRLTQEELAFGAKMNVTYLSDIERGKSNPSLLKIAMICHALDVRPSELLEGVKHSMPRRRRLNSTGEQD